MANVTDIVLARPTPLVTADAAGLEADILPRGFFQPNFVLRTDFTVGLTPALAAAGDRWRVLVAPPGSMPDHTFYIVALTCRFIGVSGEDQFLDTFWSKNAAYCISSPFDTNGARNWVWDAFTLNGTVSIFDGTNLFSFQSGNPPFNGFPPSPVIADAPAPVTSIDNALAGFNFVVGTFDAADQADMRLHVDARFLAFPRSALRSAGFYSPRMTFKVN